MIREALLQKISVLHCQSTNKLYNEACALRGRTEVALLRDATWFILKQ